MTDDNEIRDFVAEVQKEIVEARQSKPRENPPEKLFEYSLSLVSYFDILGMTVLLAKAGQDAYKVASVVRLI